MANSAGYFTEMNPAFKKVLGYSEEELRRTQFIDFVHPDDILKTKEVIENLALGQGLENFMNRYRRKDGTYVWFMWNATPYDGFIYATARVVDDLVEAREKLEERVRESEEMNRLMVGRELLMAEMKKELAALKAERQAKL
jgi:PAS domain S-box-containing protein